MKRTLMVPIATLALLFTASIVANAQDEPSADTSKRVMEEEVVEEAPSLERLFRAIEDDFRTALSVVVQPPVQIRTCPPCKPGRWVWEFDGLPGEGCKRWRVTLTKTTMYQYPWPDCGCVYHIRRVEQCIKR